MQKEDLMVFKRGQIVEAGESQQNSPVSRRDVDLRKQPAIFSKSAGQPTSSGGLICV
jgi:hypothetical protein